MRSILFPARADGADKRSGDQQPIYRRIRRSGVFFFEEIPPDLISLL
jgi:hypothetical protein